MCKRTNLDAGASHSKHLLELLGSGIESSEVEGQALDSRLELDEVDLILLAVDGLTLVVQAQLV